MSVVKSYGVNMSVFWITSHSKRTILSTLFNTHRTRFTWEGNWEDQHCGAERNGLSLPQEPRKGFPGNGSREQLDAVDQFQQWFQSWQQSGAFLSLPLFLFQFLLSLSFFWNTLMHKHKVLSTVRGLRGLACTCTVLKHRDTISISH